MINVLSPSSNSSQQRVNRYICIVIFVDEISIIFFILATLPKYSVFHKRNQTVHVQASQIQNLHQLVIAMAVVTNQELRK